MPDAFENFSQPSSKRMIARGTQGCLEVPDPTTFCRARHSPPTTCSSAVMTKKAIAASVFISVSRSLITLPAVACCRTLDFELQLIFEEILQFSPDQRAPVIDHGIGEGALCFFSLAVSLVEIEGADQNPPRATGVGPPFET